MEGLDPDLAAQLENPEILDATIAAMLEALDGQYATSPERPTLQASVGSLLLHRFGKTGSADDLDSAIRLTGESARAIAEGDPELPAILRNLVTLRLARYNRANHRADLDLAVEAGRQAAGLTPAGDPARGRCLLALAKALLTRSILDSSDADLDEAIESHYVNLRSLGASDPVLETVYGQLINDLMVRFEIRSDENDLHRAVQAGEAALSSLPDLEQQLWMSNNLAFTLTRRFDRLGALDDLTRSIDLLRRVVAAVPANSSMLWNLGYALNRRFENLGAEADMHEAVNVARAAVQASEDGAMRRENLRNLGNALNNRFSWSGGIEDINESVSALRQAVDGLGPELPPMSQAMHLSDLANALRLRFGHTRDRFARRGETTDLDEAIDALRKAARMTQDGNAMQTQHLLNLSLALSDRFGQTQRTEDLDDSVAAAQASLRTAPAAGTHLWMACHAQLATGQLGRFHLKNDPADLDHAVEVLRTALRNCRPEHSLRTMILAKLGTALLTRCRHRADHAACDEAIAVFREAVGLTREGMPFWAEGRTALADALRQRAELTGKAEDLAEAIQWWRTVATTDTAPLPSRIEAASAWAHYAGTREDWPEALAGYTLAVALLPMVAWRGAGRADRERFVANWSGLATTAAACAIAAGEPWRALELLEQGRGVLWSQLLETRTDLAVLADHAPELARRLAEVRAALDAPPTAPAPGSAERWVDNQLMLAQEWEELVQRARSTSGSAEFLRRSEIGEGFSVPAGDAVVVVNVAALRCDAIVTTSDGVRIVPLPLLTAADVVTQVNRHLTALQRHERAQTDPVLRVEFELTITAVLEWLWETIAAPVLDALGHQGTPASGARRPRVWWSPTGPLTLVPLHAAGHHGSGGGHTVMDRVISSYAPTLRTLRQAWTSEERPQTTGEMLMVAMSATPGQAPLPNVRHERETLSRLFGKLTVLQDDEADRPTVTRALDHYPWVHFACHGTQDLADPSSGGVLLHDGFLTVSDLDASHHERGEFAYLSACRTAVGGVEALDEAITTVTAFQHAGWQHVIGTLWAVWDDAAAEVAAAFYTEQLRGGEFTPATSAQALHHAVRGLRDREPHRPSIWAPFVHTGP